MAADVNNEKLIARYLLGDLPEEQQVEIEDRAFADKEYLALVTGVENDLIDEYVRRELSETDRRKFEGRFLASAERRKRVEFASALARVPVSIEKTVVSQPAQWTWRDSLYAFFVGLNPAVKFATIGVMLAFIMGSVWLFSETMRLRSQLARQQAQNQARQNELQQQVEAERRRNEELTAQLTQEQQPQQPQPNEESTPTPQPVIASLTLLPGLSRGGSEKSSLVLADDTRLVRLQIGIDPGEPYKTFSVDLHTSVGRQVWTREHLTTHTRGKARAITVTLPASSLKPGDYELRLSARQDGGASEDIGFYYFNVKKR